MCEVFRNFVRLVAFTLPLMAMAAEAVRTPPIRKQGFLKAIEIGGLSPDELIRYVQELGVDFRLSNDERQQLAKAGVEPRVIRVVEQSYRAPAAFVPPPSAPVVAPKPALLTAPPPELDGTRHTATGRLPAVDAESARLAQLSFGSPLLKEQLIAFLKEGLNAGFIEQMVERRGIEFVMTPVIAQELKAAGANRELLGVLALTKATKIDPPAAPAPVVSAAPAAVPPPVSAAKTTVPVATPPKPPSFVSPNGQPINQATATLIYAGFKPAMPLTKVKPEFPASARSSGGGVALMELEVAEDGTVSRVKGIRGPIQLIYSAQQAARKWTFEPATFQGKPVRVLTQVEFVFKSGN